MKIIYYLFFILFCSVQLSGQMKGEPIAENRALSSERKNFDALFAQLELYFESDSLLSQKEQLITVHDMAIRNNLKDFLSVIDLNLAIILQAEGNYRESISVGKEGAQVARELKDMEGLTKCLNIIAISYLKIPALDSAGIYLDEAFELAETYNYTVLKAPILNNLASLELQVGNKEDAVSIYLQLVDLYEAEHKHSSTAVVYNNLAEASRSTGNYTLALEYGRKSRLLFDSLSDWQGVIMSSINLAHTYAEIDSMELSRKMFYEALSLSQSVKDSFQIAVIHHGIAKYWMKNERYEKAKAHLDTSMQICLKKGYLVGQMRNYRAFASLSNQKGLYQLAISDLEAAKHIADELNLEEEKMGIFDLFYKSYEGMGNQTAAIKYLELKYQLKDSLLLDKRDKMSSTCKVNITGKGIKSRLRN